MDKIPIPDHVMIEDLKKDYGCPICHEILTNVVVAECCGVKMCRYCFVTSVKKNPKCPSCLEKCKTALDYPKVDNKIDEVFAKVGPKLQAEREMFLKNRKLHEIIFDLDEEYDKLNQQEKEALAAMNADNGAAKNELIPGESKSEKKLLFEKSEFLKKVKRQVRQRRFRRGNVQRNPFKKPLAINSTGSLRGDFLVRKAFMAQHGFKHPSKMDFSASAYAIRSLYAKPNSVTSAPSLATPKGQIELTQAELKVEHKRTIASIKQKRILEAKKRLGFGIGLGQGDASLDEAIDMLTPDESPSIEDMLKSLNISDASESKSPLAAADEEEEEYDLPGYLTLESYCQENKISGTEEEQLLHYWKAMSCYLHEMSTNALSQECDLSDDDNSGERESINEFRSQIMELQCLIGQIVYELRESGVVDGVIQTEAAEPLQLAEATKNVNCEEFYKAEAEDHDFEYIPIGFPAPTANLNSNKESNQNGHDAQAGNELAEPIENLTSDEDSESIDDKGVEIEPDFVEMATFLNWENEFRSNNDDYDDIEEDAQSENKLASMMNILISDEEYESNTDDRTDTELAKMMANLNLE